MPSIAMMLFFMAAGICAFVGYSYYGTNNTFAYSLLVIFAIDTLLGHLLFKKIVSAAKKEEARKATEAVGAFNRYKEKED